MTDAWPELGVLRITCDTTGESKVKDGTLVPATPPTVIVLDTVCSNEGAALPTIDVDEVQAEVNGAIADSTVDALKSTAPKFKPVTVTEDPPDNGTFRYKYESSAASNENKLTLQPAW